MKLPAINISKKGVNYAMVSKEQTNDKRDANHILVRNSNAEDQSPVAFPPSIVMQNLPAKSSNFMADDSPSPHKGLIKNYKK